MYVYVYLVNKILIATSGKRGRKYFSQQRYEKGITNRNVIIEMFNKNEKSKSLLCHLIYISFIK